MATVVNNFDNFIEYIVSAFEAEMHNVERNNIWAAIANGNPYPAHEAFTCSRRSGPEHEQQRNALRSALRSALRRVLGTEEQQAEMMLPAAEEAIQIALAKLKNWLGGYHFR